MVPGPGLIRALETGSHNRRYARGGATTTQAATVRIKLRLRRLIGRRRGRVTVRLTITFTPTDGLPRTVHARVRLKRSSRRAKRSADARRL